jgi:hypothetical protein
VELWARKCPVILPKLQLPLKFRDLLHAANLRHGTDGFTSPPKEGVLRIFLTLKKYVLLLFQEFSRRCKNRDCVKTVCQQILILMEITKHSAVLSLQFIFKPVRTIHYRYL